MCLLNVNNRLRISFFANREFIVLENPCIVVYATHSCALKSKGLPGEDLRCEAAHRPHGVKRVECPIWASRQRFRLRVLRFGTFEPGQKTATFSAVLLPTTNLRRCRSHRLRLFKVLACPRAPRPPRSWSAWLFYILSATYTLALSASSVSVPRCR